MKINNEKLAEHIRKAILDTFSAAVANTIATKPKLIEKYMKQYKKENQQSNMQYFVSWLFNEGNCTYKLELFDNNVSLAKYERKIN